jgi:hypothetical protein
MRARNELNRLAAAGRALQTHADALVGAHEEEAILERIVATGRSSPKHDRRRTLTLVLAGTAVVAIAAVAALETTGGQAQGHRSALTGAPIELAGYRFRTPAGFTASSGSCPVLMSTLMPGQGPPSTTLYDGFAAAGSAQGGCIQAFLQVPGYPGGPPLPTDAERVTIREYPGYIVDHGFAQGSEGETLYVDLLQTEPNGRPIFLMLYSEGLTKEQLIAVAASGLPLAPTTTTGTETTG